MEQICEFLWLLLLLLYLFCIAIELAHLTHDQDDMSPNLYIKNHIINKMSWVERTILFWHL